MLPFSWDICYNTSFIGAHNFSVIIYPFPAFFPELTSSYHSPSVGTVFGYSQTVSPGLTFLGSSSPMLRTACWTSLPRCSVGTLNSFCLRLNWLASQNGSHASVSKPRWGLLWTHVQIGCRQIRFEFSNLASVVLHIPTVVPLFPMSPLVPGPWPPPQAPYIFTLLCSALAIPSIWSVLSVPFEMQNPVQILLPPWSFSLFYFDF